MDLVMEVLEVLSVMRTDDILCRARCSDGVVNRRKQPSPVQRNGNDTVRWVQRMLVERSAQGEPWKWGLPEAFTTSLLVWGFMPAEHGPSLFIGIADKSFSGAVA